VLASIESEETSNHPEVIIGKRPWDDGDTAEIGRDDLPMMNPWALSSDASDRREAFMK
jgi:hypothetical protein